MPDDTTDTLPFLTRLWFAWACFFRVLFDGNFAARVFQVRDPESRRPTLPPAVEHKSLEPTRPDAGVARAKHEQDHPAAAAPLTPRAEAATEAPSVTAALQLLALLQREGRLVDFLEQDIEPFGDAEIGAAVRVVHAGCRKAIRSHAKLAPVRTEEEGTSVTLPEGFDPHAVKLSGNVQGSAPYKGILRHRGWRATELVLPTPVAGHDAQIVAPAEVEL